MVKWFNIPHVAEQQFLKPAWKNLVFYHLIPWYFLSTWAVCQQSFFETNPTGDGKELAHNYIFKVIPDLTKVSKKRNCTWNLISWENSSAGKRVEKSKPAWSLLFQQNNSKKNRKFLRYSSRSSWEKALAIARQPIWALDS